MSGVISPTSSCRVGGVLEFVPLCVSVLTAGVDARGGGGQHVSLLARIPVRVLLDLLRSPLCYQVGEDKELWSVLMLVQASATASHTDQLAFFLVVLKSNSFRSTERT